MSISPIAGPGGSGDTVAADLEAAIANAAGVRHALESDTFGQGSTIGDLLDLPPGPDAASKHLGGPDTGYPA